MPSRDQGTPREHEAIISRISDAQFNSAWKGQGYDEREIDDFLDDVIKHLSTGRLPDSAKLRGTTFDTTWIRPGYAIADVHDLLDEVARYVDSARLENKGILQGHERMIRRIQDAKFNAILRGKGYNEKEVDDYLDGIVKTLSEGHLPDSLSVRNAHFEITWIRPGYMITEVRELLDEIARYVGDLNAIVNPSITRPSLMLRQDAQRKPTPSNSDPSCVLWSAAASL